MQVNALKQIFKEQMITWCFKNVNQWDWKELRGPNFLLWLQRQIVIG